MGHEVKSAETLHVNERTIGPVFNHPITVRAFSRELAGISKQIKPSGAPLTFKAVTLDRPEDVTLVSFYKRAQQYYNLYWKIQNA